MFQSIQKWRMRNQLKLYFLLLSLFSTTLLAIILVITQNIVYKEVVTITQQISNKITENQVSQQFQIQMELFFQILNKSKKFPTFLDYRNLDKIVEIFEFSSRFENLLIQLPDQCPINQTAQYRVSNICYNILNLNQGQELNNTQLVGLSQYLHHQSLLQESLALLDPEQYIIGNWSIGYAEYYFFSAYQAIGYYSNFNITNRPFYKNHIAKANSSDYIFSDVFFNFEGFYKVTISKNLTKKIQDGIVATQFEFSIIKKFFQENFLILNKDGLILIGNIQMYFKPNFTNVYFFNESLTGFNQDDWNSITQQIYDNITSNNCSLEYSNFLCRYNKITQIDVVFYAKFFKFSNLILIILKDIIKDQDLENQLIWIENQKNIQITSLIIFQVIAAFGASLIAVLLVRYICRYMTNLERLANTHFQNKPVVDYQVYQFLKEIKSLEESHSSNITLNLSDCYYKLILQLTERPFTKNEECKIFEAFQFPQRKKLQANKIKNLMNDLKDRKGYVKSTYKEYILKVLRNQQKFI